MARKPLPQGVDQFGFRRFRRDSKNIESDLDLKLTHYSIHTLASGISDIGLLGMIVVSPDNHLDELVAHYVLLRKVNELDAFQVREYALSFN